LSFPFAFWISGRYCPGLLYYHCIVPLPIPSVLPSDCGGYLNLISVFAFHAVSILFPAEFCAFHSLLEMQSEQVLLPLSPVISNGCFHMNVDDTRGAQEFLSRDCYESLLSNSYFMLYPTPTLSNNNSSSSSLEACKPLPKGCYIRQDSAASSCQTACNSASDELEEQQHIINDERRERRMLSNRESARRSRMRKQKHLDELRAQVAHMRAENRQILSSFDILTQRYRQVLEENSLLKTETLELSQRLHQLQQAITASQWAEDWGLLSPNVELKIPYPQFSKCQNQFVLLDVRDTERLHPIVYLIYAFPVSFI